MIKLPRIKPYKVILDLPYTRDPIALKSKWQEQTKLERIFWFMRSLIIEIFGDFSQIWDKIAAGIQFWLVKKKNTRLLTCWRLQSYYK